MVAAALAASLVLGASAPAFADYNNAEQFLKTINTVRCKDSKAFRKVQKKEINGIKRKQKKFEEGSPVYYQQQIKIDYTNERFDKIAESGQFCDERGIPTLISDPGLAFKTGRAQDTVIPAFGLFYFTGWILHQGKKQLQWVKATSKTAKEARERELATSWDYAMTLYFIASGWAWPIDAFKELRNGTITKDSKYVTEPPF